MTHRVDNLLYSDKKLVILNFSSPNFLLAKVYEQALINVGRVTRNPARFNLKFKHIVTSIY